MPKYQSGTVLRQGGAYAGSCSVPGLLLLGSQVLLLPVLGIFRVESLLTKPLVCTSGPRGEGHVMA